MAQKKLDSKDFQHHLERAISQWSAPLGFMSALILAVGVGIPTGINVYQSWDSIEDKERAKTGIELIQMVATMVGGVAIFWNIVLARQQLISAQEQNITDRFSRAVELLGHDQASVRIGSIYALERIAQDSQRDHWPIMEVLAAFVRDRRSLSARGEELATSSIRFEKDVQAAIIVIGRRNISNDPRDRMLFLSHSDLRKIAFHGDTYRNTLFNYSDLREANFYRANLRKARFWRANLGGTSLVEADLTDADLVETDLRSADLRNCILKDADIQNANFEGAKNLTLEQIQSAKNWQMAIYDSHVYQLLELPQNNP